MNAPWHPVRRLVVRCQDHPTYRGLRKPRVDCEACEYIHELRGATVMQNGSTIRVGSA